MENFTNQPSEDSLEETKLCKRTNILSERDFAQMDRKVRQKQNISTIAASGTIMFLNNRTINWSNSKTEEDLEKIVTIARKAPPLCIKYYTKKERKITQTGIDPLEKKKFRRR